MAIANDWRWDWSNKLSNCCGVPIMNHDICSDCKEHCEPMEEEDA